MENFDKLQLNLMEQNSPFSINIVGSPTFSASFMWYANLAILSYHIEYCELNTINEIK